MTAPDAPSETPNDPTLDTTIGENVARITEQPGSVIGRYHVLRIIAEGGFGTVFEAEQREPVRRRVALKVIKLGMDTKRVIARFEAERQALALMDHPNIAKVLDAGATDTGRPYFVMELVHGVPITHFCDQNHLTIDERLRLFQTVCRAVQHAHQKGIIHRDIKPSNVLVTFHDNEPVAKVIDFGVAKAMHTPLTDRTILTQESQFVGTPEYMSPEQATGSGLDIDTRTDVYSLGVLLYELLTGVTPFESDRIRSASHAELQRILGEEEPSRPSTRVGSSDGRQAIAARRRTEPGRLVSMLRGDLDWIVMRAMAKVRSRRYETANALAVDIQRFLGDEPVEASPPSTAYRVQKFIRRNRGPVFAGVVIALLLLGGFGGTMYGYISTSRVNSELDAAIKDVRKQRDLAQANEKQAIEANRRAQRQLERAQEVKRLITRMLSSVEPLEAQEYDTALLRRILDETSDYVADGNVTDPVVEAEIRFVIGDTYLSLGAFDEARPHLEAALLFREKELGPNDTETLNTIGTLGRLYWMIGRIDDGEQLLKRSLTGKIDTLGEDHEVTIRAMANLGALYLNLDRTSEAETLLMRALRAATRALGERHVVTLGLMNNIALVLVDQQRLTEAEALQVRALELQREVLGEGHPHTLMSIGNLANLYREEGRLDEAERMCVELLEIHTRIMGADHPQTLLAQHNLAIVFNRQGRLDEAESLFRETFDARRTIFGLDHRDTLGTMTYLGMVLHEQSRHEEAIDVLHECLQSCRRVYGSMHPVTRTVVESLGASHRAMGRDDEADSLEREVLRIEVEKALVPDAGANQLNIAAWLLLTHTQEELRDVDQALSFAQRACSQSERDTDGRLWMYLDTLALALFESGRVDEAMETQRKAIAQAPANIPQTTQDELHAHLEKYVSRDAADN